MHRRIDGSSPDPAFAGPTLISQLLARDSPRCRVVDSVVDRQSIGGDYRSRPGQDLAAAQGSHLTSAPRPAC